MSCQSAESAGRMAADDLWRNDRALPCEMDSWSRDREGAVLCTIDVVYAVPAPSRSRLPRQCVAESRTVIYDIASAWSPGDRSFC